MEDLTKGIQVSELRSDGTIVENVEVAPETGAVKTAVDDVAKGIAVVAKAPINVPAGKPESPGTPPETQKSLDDIAAANARAKQAPLNQPKGAPEAPSVSVPVEAPKTRAGLITAAYNHLQSLQTEDLETAYAALVSPPATPQVTSVGPEAAPKPEDKNPVGAPLPGAIVTAGQAAAVPDTPPDAPQSAPATDKGADAPKEDDKEKPAEKPVGESLDTLMQAEAALSETFRSKATGLFESAVKEKVAAEVTRIEENYQTQLNEEIAKATTGLSEKVDKYLNYVVSTWVEENKVAIESGLRTEIAENFINSLKSVFVENYISVPEGKEDLVTTLTGKTSQLEEQLLAQTTANMNLNESINALKREKVLAEASRGLAATEVEKLKSLTESTDFENAESFAKKVTTIKESHFHKSVTPATEADTETGSDEPSSNAGSTSLMEAASVAISRTVKK